MRWPLWACGGNLVYPIFLPLDLKKEINYAVKISCSPLGCKYTTNYFLEPVIFVWLVQRPNRMRYREL